MANRIWTSLVAALLVSLIAGCATPPAPVAPVTDRITLLPQADGAASAVVVRSGGGRETVLAQPYATAIVSASRVETSVGTAQDMRERYKALFDAMPPARKSFLVYFEVGGDRLTPDSAQRLNEILSQVSTMPAPEVLVVGHTDTLGSASLNDELSMQRARIVRARLIEKGIEPSRIESVGRGKRELLIPTRDEVSEPRNRRVEIQVR